VDRLRAGGRPAAQRALRAPGHAHALVDDEPLARRRIRDLLAGEPDVAIAGECEDGDAAVDAIRDAAPDLLFLDIQMPGLDGFGVLEAVGAGRVPAVVFVTAFDSFAVRAFETHALDYLLKPFDDERFAATLERVRQRLGSRGTGEEMERRLQRLLDALGQRRRHLKRLAVRTGNRVRLVATEDIDWFEAEGKYVRLHTRDGTHLVRDSLGRLETVLDPARYLRIHRSTLVNLDRVRELEPLLQGDYVVILRDGTRLTTGRSYRPAVQRLLAREG
jgi:two-component system, LytTR family, response regulator